MIAASGTAALLPLLVMTTAIGVDLDLLFAHLGEFFLTFRLLFLSLSSSLRPSPLDKAVYESDAAKSCASLLVAHQVRCVTSSSVRSGSLHLLVRNSFIIGVPSRADLVYCPYRLRHVFERTSQNAYCVAVLVSARMRARSSSCAFSFLPSPRPLHRA